MFFQSPRTTDVSSFVCGTFSDRRNSFMLIPCTILTVFIVTSNNTFSLQLCLVCSAGEVKICYLDEKEGAHWQR